MPAKTERRTPRQERSRQLRADLLTAAVRVLRAEGAHRFTTTRVAKAAGVSIGSLYQYFPDKRALVAAVHDDVVAAAWVEVQRILDDPSLTHRARIREIARGFFRAEADDLGRMGSLLDPEDEPHPLEAEVAERFTRFVRDVLPAGTPEDEVRFRAALLTTVLEGVGRTVAGRAPDPSSVDRWADRTADLLADDLGLPA